MSLIFDVTLLCYGQHQLCLMSYTYLFLLNKGQIKIVWINGHTKGHTQIPMDIVHTIFEKKESIGIESKIYTINCFDIKPQNL